MSVVSEGIKDDLALDTLYQNRMDRIQQNLLTDFLKTRPCYEARVRASLHNITMHHGIPAMGLGSGQPVTLHRCPIRDLKLLWDTTPIRDPIPSKSVDIIIKHVRVSCVGSDCRKKNR